MGKYFNGILGGFRGKVGNVIGGTWKGIPYMRARSGPRSGKLTEAQLIQQAKFGLAARFLQPLQPVLKVGFRTQVSRQTAQNAAMSDVLSHVIEGSPTDLHINFSRLRLAKGTLLPPVNGQVAIENDRLIFTWTNNTGAGDASEDDQALLVACGDGFPPSYSMDDYTRGDERGELSLPMAPSGQIVYAYLAFAATDLRKEVSNSLLVGTVTIP